MLKKLGLRWQLANNGAEAVERARECEFDLVLMDCQMPVMDGYRATRLIREFPDGRGARLPIIALTANTMQGDEQKCMDAGMNAFLAKPYTLATLRAKLVRWLPHRPPETPDAQPHGQHAALPLPTPSAETPAINPAVLDTLRELDEAGGTDLAREIFSSFLETADHGFAQVQAAVQAGDAKGLGHAAHALKSSTANVGAQALSACYRELERLGRENRIDEAQALLAQTQREHRRAVSQLNELLMDFA